MANKTLNIRLRNKYDTEANWKASNPVLLQGECAFTSDGNNKGRYKVGDGSTQWKNLSYATIPWSDVIGKPSTFTPASHTHDDRYYTESEINTKLSSKADATLSNLNVIQATRNINSAISPNAASIASSPFARDLWHDHFAFLNTHTIESNQVSTDGKTWRDDALDLKPLFQGKESQSFAILTKNIISRRFIIKSVNIAYSFIYWIELGVAYTNPFSNFTILVEKSTDKSTWTKIAEATITGGSAPYFVANNDLNDADKYLRFTFTKTTNLTTGSVSFTCIKGLSSRKGNQGLGIEYEYPYDWDSDRNIFPHTNGNRNLGSSSKKWANVYANNFVGNASTATALASSAGSATQPVYFKDGKPTACTYTLAKTVPADAKFTDTNTWRPLGTTGDTACAGNDSRLSNARPASDVYAWAKASSKPSYSWSEISSKPSSFTPSSHTHTIANITNLQSTLDSKASNSNTIKGISANGYWGLATPASNSVDWIRTTSYGLLPSQSGSARSGHSALGTSSWYFSNAYIDSINTSEIKIGQPNTSNNSAIEMYGNTPYIDFHAGGTNTDYTSRIIAYSDRIEFVFA